MRSDDFYEFDTEEVRKCFKLESLSYCNTFTLDSYMPFAVYKSGEKYLLLQQKNSPELRLAKSFWLEEGEMEKWKFQMGLRCLKCQDVIYSRYRHDMRPCKCESIYIDGGREYTRISGDAFEMVTINLLDNTYVIEPRVLENEEEKLNKYQVDFTGNFKVEVDAFSPEEAAEKVRKHHFAYLMSDKNTDSDLKMGEVCLVGKQ